MPKDVYNSHYEKLPNGEVRCIDDEIPFEIPESWAWCRIVNIASSQLGKTLDRGKEQGNEYPYLCSINVYWEGVDLTKVKTFRLKDDELERYKLTIGDLLICEGGDYGRCSVWDSPIEMYYQNALHRVRFYNNISPYFYKYVVELYRNIGYIKGQGQTIKHFTFDNMKGLLFPVPPLNEQDRIVTSIESLQPIINKYAQAQQELDNLNSEIYAVLKKSILQEAIQGRLVEQYETDEPATELLKRIQQEKQKLVKEGKLKAKDISDSIIFKGDDNKYYEKCGNAVACIDDEIPFEIPSNWGWCRLGNLISTKTGLAYSKPNLEIKSNNMVRVLRGGNISNGSWCMKSDDVMISSEFVKQDLYLRKGYFITPAVTSWESMGKTALVRENYDNVVVGGFVLMMCPFYTDGIVEEYLNYFFQSTMFQQYCQSITNKSGQAFYNLSRNKLLQLLIPIPPAEEQKRIYHRLNDALASIMSR